MDNVLFYYSSQQVHTGSPRVLMRLVEGLDRTSFRPWFLAAGEGELCRELIGRGTEIVRGRSEALARDTVPRNLLNVLRLGVLLRKNKIALVHINELGWNSELAVAAHLVGVPVVFHLHNPEKLSLRNLNCRIGSKFLFVSEALANECGARGLLGTKIDIIHNPITIELFEQGRSIRAELGVPEDAPVVGTVAQIRRGKGIDTIVETAAVVLKAMPATRFLIVGPEGLGEEQFFREMKKKVSDLNLEQRVIFCGPRHDVNNFLASIDIFFLPTRAEAFGMVVAEAMAARVPVVTSRVGGIAEILPDDSYGLALPPDNRIFHTSILSLLRDEGLRASLAKKGHERVTSLFSNRVFNGKIDRLYRTMLQRTPR